MERLTTKAIGLSTLLFSSMACADFNLGNMFGLDWQLNPSVGFDINARHQRFDTGFGDHHFRKYYPDTNFYVAARLNCYLGLELGYENMYRQTKNTFYTDGAPVLGFVAPLATDGGPGSKLYLSNAQSQGWNINLVGFWPICPRTGTDVTFTLGATWLKNTYDTVAVTENATVSHVSHFEGHRKAKLRGGLGLRQMITENFGARVQVIWQGTSNDATAPVPLVLNIDEPAVYRVNPKNTLIYGLGFFYQLC